METRDTEFSVPCACACVCGVFLDHDGPFPLRPHFRINTCFAHKTNYESALVCPTARVVDVSSLVQPATLPWCIQGIHKAL